MDYKRSLIFITTIIVLLFYCCKKDTTETADDNALVVEAKNWFISSNKNYIPNWQDAVSFSKNNIIYIILPSNYKLSADTNRIISRLIISNFGGKYSARLLEFIDSNVPGDINNIIKLFHGNENLKRLDGGYSGKVLVLSADHVFINGWQFESGAFKYTLKLKTSEGKSTLKKSF
ncbi:hypothetical protein [uncultured Pedobacter sp.]|uniref:hypothetical protein n=1 Tax=uncultured Pedobacter sp. TaxID=246139 RepID=UPI0025D522DF|nr:hypothetical protein [uncultured Pedobacter sp.]